MEADPEIIIDRDGFGIGIQAQYSVRWAPNINSAGAIDYTLLTGNHLRSHVLGISYYDWKHQLSVQIAEIKDSGGEIVGKNQMLYRDAFTGIKADVCYTYRKSGFSQNVIFKEQLPSPAEYNLDPETTQIEIWTEFLNPPKTTIRSKEDRITQQRSDAVIDFDSMRIVPGVAFNAERPARERKGIPVKKEWGTVDGRSFLVESISYKSALPETAKLPLRQQAAIKKAPVAAHHPAAKGRVAAGNLFFAERGAVSSFSQEIQVASTEPENKGFVVDYETVNYYPGSQSLTLKSGFTYHIPGGLYVDQLTIEGGAVIKLGAVSSGIDCHNIGCNTDAYRPAIVTSEHDDSVGDIIEGSNGLTDYYYPDIGISAGFEPQIHDVRFKHIWQAIFFGTEAQPGSVKNCQFVDCGWGITASAYGPGSPLSVNVENCLFYQCNRIFGGD